MSLCHKFAILFDHLNSPVLSFGVWISGIIMFRSPFLVSKPSFDSCVTKHSLDNRFRDSSFLHVVFVEVVELLDGRLSFSALFRTILINIFPEPSDGLERIAEDGSSKHDNRKDQERTLVKTFKVKRKTCCVLRMKEGQRGCCLRLSGILNSLKSRIERRNTATPFKHLGLRLQLLIKYNSF